LKYVYILYFIPSLLINDPTSCGDTITIKERGVKRKEQTIVIDFLKMEPIGKENVWWTHSGCTLADDRKK